ncbi:glycosyltransferase involved in cell wall biosynthesis [Hymenobacter sp. UYAg731]
MPVPRPKVSIVLLTYNHEAFVEQALEGILRQEVAFSYEVIVGEDCSTDQTRTLVEAYRLRFPACIKPIYQARNVGPGANLQACLAECHGEYIALVEGDDYWTDARKLAKQVQWLDAHPDFSICFHPVKIIHTDPSVADAVTSHAKEVYDFEDFLGRTILQTSSVMLRNVLRPVPGWLFGTYPLDFPFFSLYAEKGKAKLLPDTMSCYRVHPGGSWSSAAHVWKQKRFLAMYRRLVVHYAPTRHAATLRRKFYKQYLDAADGYVKHGLPQEATTTLKRVALMWRSYTPRNFKSFVGVVARWVRSPRQRPI